MLIGTATSATVPGQCPSGGVALVNEAPILPNYAERRKVAARARNQPTTAYPAWHQADQPSSRWTVFKRWLELVDDTKRHF